MKDFYTKQPWYFEYDNFNFEINVGKPVTSHEVRCKILDRKNKKGEYCTTKNVFDSIFRFFSEIVWFHHTALYDVNGGHSDYHVNLNYKVDDESYLTRFNQRISDKQQHLALGFFREAESNESPYYRFLCYAKILEIPWSDAQQKTTWIDSQIPNLSCGLAKTYRDRKIAMLGNETLSHWLHHSGRHAIAHGNLSNPQLEVIDPNNYEHWEEIKWANTLMQDLAVKLMVDHLKIPSRTS